MKIPSHSPRATSHCFSHRKVFRGWILNFPNKRLAHVTHIVRTQTHARTMRGQFADLLVLECAFAMPDDASITATSESRGAILDPLLKDTWAFHDVPYKEFNSGDSSTANRISRRFALGGSLIRLARKCSAVQEIEESSLAPRWFRRSYKRRSIDVEEAPHPCSFCDSRPFSFLEAGNRGV